MVDALRGVIQAEVAASGLGKTGGLANASTKRLRAANAVASAVEAGIDRANAQDDATERYAQSLLEKFISMGTKARGKSV